MCTGLRTKTPEGSGQPFPSPVQFYDAVLTLDFFLTVSLYNFVMFNNCTLECFHHSR